MPENSTYINPFSMPQSAGPNDRKVGEDDAGRPIHETLTGRRYTIGLDPDQRTPRKKVSDAVKSVKQAIEDWLESPELPSAEQVKDTAVGVVKGAYDQVDRLVHDEATMGEALGVAPVTAVPSFMRVKPKTPSKKGIEETEEVLTQGINPRDNDTIRLRNPNRPDEVQVELTGTQWDELLGIIEERREPGEFSPAFGGDLIDSILYFAGGGLTTYDGLRDYLNFVFDEGQASSLYNRYIDDFIETLHMPWEIDEDLLDDVVDEKPKIPPPPAKRKAKVKANTQNPKENPLLKPKGDKVFEDDAMTVASFYNPIVSSLETMTWGKNGLKGETIAANLEKRSTGVRKSLLRSTSNGKSLFEPGKRYSLDEAKKIIEDNSFSVKAVKVEPAYEQFQRFDPGLNTDSEVDYNEVILKTSGQKLSRYSGDHFDDSSLGHTRYSTRETVGGEKYILVEELQSDLIQKNFKAPRPDSSERLAPIDSVTEFVRPLLHAVIVDAKRKGVGKVVIPDSNAIISSRGSEYHQEYSAGFANTYDKAVNKVLAELDREKGVDVSIGSDTVYGRGDMEVPEYTPPSLDLEIPHRDLNADVLIKEQLYEALRYGRPTSEVIDRYVNRGWLKNGEELKAFYSDLEARSKTKEKATPVRVINIEALAFDPDNIELRFAEGGLVPGMDDQTEMAFMSEGQPVDPVSGNEIPPGSTPEEVRDDVPAKLSEGEFVIPADVVKYFGVKYFYDLIRKGKEGFAKEMDDLPFDASELQYEEEQPQQ